MAGVMCGRGCAWQGDMCGREACVAGRHVWQGGMCGRGCAWQGTCMAGEMVTAVGGMHPTGMHSCSIYVLIQNEFYTDLNGHRNLHACKVTIFHSNPRFK